MTSIEELKKIIEKKLKTLNLAVNDNDRIIHRGKEKELTKHLQFFEQRLEEIQDLKYKVEEQMIEDEKESSEIQEWATKLEGDILTYDHPVEDIEKRIQHIVKEKEIEERRDDMEQEERRLERKLKEERLITEMKLELKKSHEKKEEIGKTSTKEEKVKAKLPKLIISVFQGTHIDWFRFWNQFESDIDKSDLPAVTKLSYLRELLIPKVRKLIEGLPYTSEGYERSKAILTSKYGKPSEVANAHIQNIMALPQINNSNPVKIHEFYEKLLNSVQTLETMGKLKDINGYVRLTLDKLPGIRADLVRTDNDWQNWKFTHLVEALRHWTDRNPILFSEPRYPEKPFRTNLYQTNKSSAPECVYCNKAGHKSVECKTVKTISDRRKILSDKKLCFNCTGPRHRATDCRSTRTCQICKNKHHTSICEQSPDLLLTTNSDRVIYPVVLAKINGVKCRALLDTASGSSYASETLINKLKINPVRNETKTIETLTNFSTRKIKVYQVKIQDTTSEFTFETELNKLEREVLIKLPNPNYIDLIAKYSHLSGIKMNDIDKKPELPIHAVLGASDYTKIKTRELPRVGKLGEPFAELTKMGWVLISPGQENDLTNALFTKTSRTDYEELCSLDVLGVEDSHLNHSDEYIYEKFKKQLSRDSDGRYETGLIWKENHPPLSNNKTASFGRLRSLVKNLKRSPETFEAYDKVIRDQLENNVVEEVKSENEATNDKEFYLPHKAVIRKDAETTKLRVVYDASAKSETGVSLNECLEKGPPLQKLLWDILIRARFRPIVLCADIEKAFLQISIKNEDRNSLKFHWVNNLNDLVVKILRFTRLVFGLIQSPFILEGTLQEHFKNCFTKYQKLIERIKDDMYVDDLVTGGETTQEVAIVKNDAISMFSEGGFKLHKFHSNDPSLETKAIENNHETNYAKQQLGTKPNEIKILGVPWDKTKDTLSVHIPVFCETLTKRTVLQALASIYDPLGFISPVLLTGKIIYRKLCDLKIPWDAEIPKELQKEWIKWKQTLNSKIEIPRCIAQIRDHLSYIDIHLFNDSSILGVCVVAYAVIHQKENVNQGIITSKARLAKKNLSIPRLELVSAHMSANLAQNIKTSLSKLNLRKFYCWTDSTVVLHWLKDNGEYKIFVSNRVAKIREKNYIEWKYTPTKQNPADLGSRGCDLSKIKSDWLSGPAWLDKPDEWPEQPDIKKSEETETEKKKIKEIFAATVSTVDEIDDLLNKFSLWKFLRILGWINRFINNCRRNKVNGPLTTEEISKQKKFIIKREQKRFQVTEKFKNDKAQLNIQLNCEGILECHGRIQGEFPIYIPNTSALSEKLVEEAHRKTLHGGINLTMAKIRSQYWIPVLRQIVRKIVKKCYGCKRYHTKPYVTPVQGQLPKDRTTQDLPFKIIGLDYAGPFICKSKTKKELKVYLLLFTCSLVRAIHLEILDNQTTFEFIQALKRLIARRGRPKIIYSDNAKTFQAAEKWIQRVNKDEKCQNYLIQQEIMWKFNLSRAPWWGGQFERMIGLVKQSLYKVTGRANLSKEELQDIMLDIEITLNNRPLTYLEDDIQHSVLTPNVLIYGEPLKIPEEVTADENQVQEIKKRQRYITKCKNAAWVRWRNDYLKSLRERHNMKHKVSKMIIAVGDVVIIKGEEKHRGKWKLGIVTDLYTGSDGVIRAVKLRAGKSYMERPIQHLYPMELHCDLEKESNTDTHKEINYEDTDSKVTRETNLKPNAKEFRPKRTAAAIAEINLQDMADNDDEDDLI